MNEIIFFTHAAVIFLLTLGALRLGKEALMSWIVMQALLANLFVIKQMTIFSMQATCSDAFMLGSVLGLNLLQEFFGRDAAKRAILLAFLGMAALALLAKIHLVYESSSNDWSNEAFKTLFSSSPRLLLASLTSFFVAQQCDVRFYSWLKKRLAKVSYVVRIGCSLVVSQAIDTVLFSLLGLYGLVDDIVSIIVFSFIIKLIIAATATPFTAFAKKLAPPHEVRT
jgi:uncharacterized integral membrane protein (TIGR00697 family)